MQENFFQIKFHVCLHFNVLKFCGLTIHRIKKMVVTFIRDNFMMNIFYLKHFLETKPQKPFSGILTLSFGLT